ncbi:MAG: P1 family peptidase [Filifactor alocis]|nr:P1 family peptidase [Filifactor alocis]
MKKKMGVSGFFIGAAQNKKSLTGVSVILAPEGATAGCDVRGNAPGTRETDLLKSEKTVDKIHAVVLSGGSAFGLESACGVMDRLEEEGVGFDVQVAKVPIVAGAVLFDLAVGDPKVRPDREMGYLAAKSAKTELETGNVGAGCGATVGKLKGFASVMKGGTGYHELGGEGDLKVGAYVCVNACGEVYDGKEILAGVLNEEGTKILPARELMMGGEKSGLQGANTTIGCIITNATLTKAQCNRVAQTAHNGYALSIRPVHTSMDGDTIFCMASGKVKADVDKVSYMAQEAMREAVLDAILSAEKVEDIESCSSLRQKKARG